METRHILAAGDFHWAKQDFREGRARLDVMTHVSVVILAGDIVDQPEDREHLQLAAEWIEGLCLAHPQTEFLFVRGGHDCLTTVKPVLELEKLFRRDIGNLHFFSDDVPMMTLKGLRIAGTNWSRGHRYKHHFRRIPDDHGAIDIFVSHCPPKDCGVHHDDEDNELRDTIKRLRPQSVIFAHAHGQFGTYSVDGIVAYCVAERALLFECSDDGRLFPCADGEPARPNLA